MSVRFFDPGKSYFAQKEHIDKIMQDVLRRGDLILRKDVDEFEQELADYLGVKYVVSCASGTDALWLALQALEVGEGDTVLAPSYTFRATVEAIHRTGANIKLYDYDSPISLDGADVFLPAHIAGEVSDWTKKAMALARQFEIPIIEDSCQAIGAAPLTGVAACYSFYPAKLLGGFGDGGAVATDDKDIRDFVKGMRNHWKDDWGPYGWNSRLDNLQAAVLSYRLLKLPENLFRRKQIALQYDSHLKGVGLPKVRDVYQDYIITHPNRERLRMYLTMKGIETMENGYPFPDGLLKGPSTIQYEATSIRIPCNENLTDLEVQEVIDAINSYADTV